MIFETNKTNKISNNSSCRNNLRCHINYRDLKKELKSKKADPRVTNLIEEITL